MKNLVLRILYSRYFQIPAAVLVFYTVLGFLIAPAAVSWYIPRFCADQLKCRAEIGKVGINPFLLTVEARDFSIKGPDGDLMAGFERLFLDFEVFSLFERTARFGELVLDKPKANLVIEQDGSINFASLFPPSPESPLPDQAKTSPSDPPRLLFDSFSLTGGDFTVTHKRPSPPATLEVRDLSVVFKNLSTIRDRSGTYSLSAKTGGGETLEWRGELGLTPFVSNGRFSFSGLLATTPWAFLRDSLNLESPMGKLDFSSDYRIDSSGPALQLVLENFLLNLSGLSLKLHGEEQGFFELNKLGIESARFDLASKSLHVSKLFTEGSKLRLRVGEDGSMNMERVVRASGRDARDAKGPAPEQGTASGPESRSGALTVNIDSVELRDLSSEVRFGQKGDPGPVFDAKLLAVDGIDLKLGERAVAVSRIRLDGGRLDAGIDRDGKLDIERAFAGGSAAPDARAPGPTPDAGHAWKFLVKEFDLSNFQSAFSDYGVAEQPLYNIRDLGVRLTDIDGKSPMGAEVKFGIEQGGEVAFQGKVDPSARSVDAKVSVNGLVLTPVRPYLSRYITLTLGSAAVSTEGALRYAVPGTGSKLAYEGTFALDNLKLAHPGSDETFIGWNAMLATGLKLAVEPNNLRIDRITLAKPVGELIIAEDKTINLTKVLKEQPTPKPAPPPPPATPEKTAKGPAPPGDNRKESADSFPFSIGAIRIDEGDVLFADLSLQPKFMARIHDLKGTVTGLSSQGGTVSRIQLDGGVDKYGTAKVDGSLDIGDYKRATDITMVFRNVEMSAITPYSGRFAGRTIKSGKLSLDLKYKIQGNKLLGDNKIIVDRLVLGEHVDSPDAVNLPLDLAVALLSDSNGRIDIGLPVTGDLADPRFSLGPLIGKAITTLISKAVTAPFRALGALFGGDTGDRFDSILFDPGNAEIQPPEKEKLKNLSEALRKKPLLRLLVQGRYSPEADSVVLRERSVRRETAGRMGIKYGPGEDRELDFSDSKVRGALEKIFSDRFGKKALDEVDQAVKKGEIKPRESSAEASRQKKSKKVGIVSKALSAAKVYKVVPGMKSPEQSETLARELFARLVESEPAPEKELLELASARERSVTAEIVKIGIIGTDRFQTKNPEPAPGDEGLSAKLSLDSIK